MDSTTNCPCKLVVSRVASGDYMYALNFPDLNVRIPIGVSIAKPSENIIDGLLNHVAELFARWLVPAIVEDVRGDIEPPLKFAAGNYYAEETKIIGYLAESRAGMSISAALRTVADWIANLWFEADYSNA